VEKKLHNEELNDLYSSPNIVQVIKLRKVRWAGHVAHTWIWICVILPLVWKSERRRPLRRPKHG
jgi:hypothetical protein